MLVSQVYFGGAQDVPSLHSACEEGDGSIRQGRPARWASAKVSREECWEGVCVCVCVCVVGSMEGLENCVPSRSAGASLRRYNESALAGEIRDLMSSWQSYIDEASCVFIRTPKYSKGVLIGDGGKAGKAPFVRGDPRLREIPFPTRRPTLKEVEAVHSKLAAIYVGVARREELSSQDIDRRGVKNVGAGKGEEPQKGVCPTDKNRTSNNGDRDQDIPNNDLPTANVNAVHPDTTEADLNAAGLETNAPTTNKRKKKAKKPAVEPSLPAVQSEWILTSLLVVMVCLGGVRGCVGYCGL